MDGRGRRCVVGVLKDFSSKLFFASSRPLVNLAEQWSRTSSMTTEVNHEIDNIQAVLQCVCCWASRRVEVEVGRKVSKREKKEGRLSGGRDAFVGAGWQWQTQSWRQGQGDETPFDRLSMRGELLCSNVCPNLLKLSLGVFILFYTQRGQ